MENRNLQTTSFSSLLEKIYSYFLMSVKFIKNNLNFASIAVSILIFLEIIKSALKSTLEVIPKLEISLVETATTSIVYFIFSFLTYIIFDIFFINYLHRKEGFSFKNLKSDIKKQFFPVAKVKILIFLHVFVGLLFFIVPGIIVALRYTFIIYFTICYNQPFNIARENSMKLMDGYKWYFFLLYTMLICFIIITGLILGSAFVYMDELKMGYISSLIDYGIYSLIEIMTYTILYLFWKDRARNSNT